MGDVTMCTPWQPAPEFKKPDMQSRDERQLLTIKALIASIQVPRPSTFSQESTQVDDTTTLLLPKVVDLAAPESIPNSAYGTFNPEAHTVVPLHPNSLLTSAALTPVYLVLMLLPMLPFWMFAGFLLYVAATQPLAEIRVTLVALAFLLPFNIVGTVAVIRFAMQERRKAVEATAEDDVESGSFSRRSSGSGMSEKKRLWRPSMQFVLHGAQREGRRL